MNQILPSKFVRSASNERTIRANQDGDGERGKANNSKKSEVEWENKMAVKPTPHDLSQ